jgi:hypothetical protein
MIIVFMYQGNTACVSFYVEYGLGRKRSADGNVRFSDLTVIIVQDRKGITSIQFLHV